MLLWASSDLQIPSNAGGEPAGSPWVCYALTGHGSRAEGKLASLSSLLQGKGELAEHTTQLYTALVRK